MTKKKSQRKTVEWVPGPVPHSEIEKWCAESGDSAPPCSEGLTDMFNQFYSKRDWKNTKGEPLKGWKAAYIAYLRYLAPPNVIEPRVRIAEVVKDAASSAPDPTRVFRAPVENPVLEEAIETAAPIEVPIEETVPESTLEERAKASWDKAQQQIKETRDTKEVTLEVEVPVYTEAPTEVPPEQDLSYLILVLWAGIAALILGVVLYFLADWSWAPEVWDRCMDWIRGL